VSGLPAQATCQPAGAPPNAVYERCRIAWKGGSVARGVGFQMSASDLAKPAACVAGMAAWEPAVWWRRRGAQPPGGRSGRL